MVQKGDVFRALFRVNAYNKLEVCSNQILPYPHFLLGDILWLRFFILFSILNVRHIAKLMEYKRMFSLVVWWPKTEL